MLPHSLGRGHVINHVYVCMYRLRIGRLAPLPTYLPTYLHLTIWKTIIHGQSASLVFVFVFVVVVVVLLPYLFFSFLSSFVPPFVNYCEFGP
ncbi:hypothetical protein K504DRAFT_38666 [Pleomassaria siparia CBS 279.74]|uniref:Uncharacterized protein n=1 Tax=Pleomassaria siparia CBS 279.74 TaxID=1314801 RepID=A0A6G1K540_9PLEO|nr:hypothetical protein K504DRAFT_38666 [Pleomassaria siparia CBS 279.74]